MCRSIFEVEEGPHNLCCDDAYHYGFNVDGRLIFSVTANYYHLPFRYIINYILESHVT